MRLEHSRIGVLELGLVKWVSLVLLSLLKVLLDRESSLECNEFGINGLGGNLGGGSVEGSLALVGSSDDGVSLSLHPCLERTRSGGDLGGGDDGVCNLSSR